MFVDYYFLSLSLKLTLLPLLSPFLRSVLGGWIHWSPNCLWMQKAFPNTHRLVRSRYIWSSLHLISCNDTPCLSINQLFKNPLHMFHLPHNEKMKSFWITFIIDNPTLKTSRTTKVHTAQLAKLEKWLANWLSITCQDVLKLFLSRRQTHSLPHSWRLMQPTPPGSLSTKS